MSNRSLSGVLAYPNMVSGPGEMSDASRRKSLLNWANCPNEFSRLKRTFGTFAEGASGPSATDIASEISSAGFAVATPARGACGDP